MLSQVCRWYGGRFAWNVGWGKMWSYFHAKIWVSSPCLGMYTRPCQTRIVRCMLHFLLRLVHPDTKPFTTAMNKNWWSKVMILYRSKYSWNPWFVRLNDSCGIYQTTVFQGGTTNLRMIRRLAVLLMVQTSCGSLSYYSTLSLIFSAVMAGFLNHQQSWKAHKRKTIWSQSA